MRNAVLADLGTRVVATGVGCNMRNCIGAMVAMSFGGAVYVEALEEFIRIDLSSVSLTEGYL